MKDIRKALSKSLALQTKAKDFIPGISQMISKRPERFSEGVWPGYFSRAKGCEVWDLDGNKYIDMSIGGIGANVLGYADPDVDDAAKKAIDNGTSSSLNCPEEIELAELLCELHPWAERIRYARSGGEAMAIAVRIARAYTGCDIVVFCGYHGWHDWYLAANIGIEDALKDHLQAGLSSVGVPISLNGTALPFKYNDLRALEELVFKNKDNLAAIVMEPVRNIQPADGFLSGVCDLAKRVKAVLVFDEISSGFRLNTGGAHLTFGVSPDIAVFSKGMSNGYPMAAVIGKGSVMDSAQRTFISSTYWTERLGPVAALATIKKHRRVNAGKHLIATGKKVQNGLRSLADKHDLDLDIHGIPPLTHFVFNTRNPAATKALYVQIMLEQGFLASNLFYSMYTHTMQNVQDYLKATDRAFAEIVDAELKNEVEKRLIGQPSVAGFNRLT